MSRIDGLHDEPKKPSYDRALIEPPPGFTLKDFCDIPRCWLVDAQGQDIGVVSDRSFEFLDDIYNRKLSHLIERKIAENRKKRRKTVVVDLGSGPSAYAADGIAHRYRADQVEVHAFDLCTVPENARQFHKPRSRFRQTDLTQGIPLKSGVADVVYSHQFFHWLPVNPHAPMPDYMRRTLERIERDEFENPDEAYMAAQIRFHLKRILKEPLGWEHQVILGGLPDAETIRQANWPAYEAGFTLIKEVARILRPGGEAMIDEDGGGIGGVTAHCSSPFSTSPIALHLLFHHKVACWARAKEDSDDGRPVHIMGGEFYYLHMTKDPTL